MSIILSLFMVYRLSTCFTNPLSDVSVSVVLLLTINAAHILFENPTPWRFSKLFFHYDHA